MNVRALVGATMLLMGVVACSGKSSPGPAALPAQSAPATALAGNDAATTAAGSPALDIASFRACEIVTPQEAATIIGGKLLNEPPAGFPNCAYVMEVGGATESYRLSFSTPAMYEALLETQSAAERGDPVAGLWDEAYVQPRALGNGYTLMALQRGKLALEVSGDRKEPLAELARLAVSRVP
jgi:hypothetical protein